MGLWGSKQTKDINIKNPEADSSEIYITQNALLSVLEPPSEVKLVNNAQKSPEDSVLTTLQIDKRVQSYEENLLKTFDESTRRVEDLFNDRYQQLPVCIDLQKETSHCYSEFPDQPLRCLDIANKFIKCIEAERLKHLGHSFMKPNST